MISFYIFEELIVCKDEKGVKLFSIHVEDGDNKEALASLGGALIDVSNRELESVDTIQLQEVH